ncbi:MAG: hypothetical protein ABNH30_07145, partial [Thalassolituus sp.]
MLQMNGCLPTQLFQLVCPSSNSTIFKILNATNSPTKKPRRKRGFFVAKQGNPYYALFSAIFCFQMTGPVLCTDSPV